MSETTIAEVAVVGAGAAGLMTAIVAAREAPQLRVVLLEGARRPGAKILVSGGGRCNVTNRVAVPADFHGDRKAIARVLKRFGIADTITFFASIGVELVHEPEFDKLFPKSNRAREVLDGLLAETTRLGVTLMSDTRVTSVTQEGDGFRVAAGEREVRASQVVLATGGQALPKSGSDGYGYGLARHLGHSLTAVVPALVPLTLDPHPLSARTGVSFPAEFQVWRDGRCDLRVRGPVLITHFGLSGPAALDVSRHYTVADGNVELRLNFFVGSDPRELSKDWIGRAGKDGSRLVRSLLEALPGRVAEALLEIAGIDPRQVLARLDRESRQRLLTAATALPLAVSGTRGFVAAEVTAGGIPLTEVDVRTMVSRVCHGLYLVGEIVDVDGRIGGFNFQWAWATGFIAGVAIAALH